MTDEAVPVSPRTSGRAFRVSILGSDQVECYTDVHVELDGANAVVHVFDADARLHYLTIPLSVALIEWQDSAVLQPEMRLPAFGAGAFQHLGEQVQRMVEGMTHGLGKD